MTGDFSYPVSLPLGSVHDGNFSHPVPLPLGSIHEKASLKETMPGARNQGEVCWEKAREAHLAATNLGAVDHVSQGGALGKSIMTMSVGGSGFLTENWRETGNQSQIEVNDQDTGAHSGICPGVHRTQYCL